MTENVSESHLHTLSVYETSFWFSIYGVIAFLAIGGNFLVIYIMCIRFKTHSATTYFIVNLSIADMLTGTIAIPFKFQSARLQSWELPHFMCVVLPFIETVSLSVSVFTLTASAVDRFCAIMCPDMNKMTESFARKIVVGIWMFSIGCSLPYGIYHQVYPFDPVTFTLHESAMGLNGSAFVWQCLPIYHDKSWWKAYNVYLTIVQYFVPVIIIDTVYIIIGYNMWRAEPVHTYSRMREAFQKNKRVVLKMLVIVVTVFTLCWLPYETYLMLCELYPNINDFYYINVVFFAFHWLAMSNSCLNPIIYGIYNEKIKQEYKQVILPALCTCCYSKVERIAVDSEHSDSEHEAPDLHRRTSRFSYHDLQTVPKISMTISQYIACELGKDDETTF